MAVEKETRLMTHTLETKHRAMLLDSWSESLFVAKSTMRNSPDFWSVGHSVTETLTSSLSWKTEVCVTTVREKSPEKRNDTNVHELQSALAKLKNTKPKVQGCLACEHGINVNLGRLGRKHTFECRKTILPSLVTDSLWTVKFDADGKVLKRHEHEGDHEHRVSKRVRFTHKQPDKVADMELTDDTVAKRATLSDTPSFSSSSHEIAPNLYDSSGEVEEPDTRGSVMRKSRVDADMEISAIEALTNAKFEVGRALEKANKTLHRLLEELPLESEAVTKAAELNSIRDKRVHTEVYESEADAKIISDKRVLKPQKARYVLRGFDEDVKDEDVFAARR